VSERTLLGWLLEPWDGGALPFGGAPPVLPPQPSRLAVYAALIGMNGGHVTVSGWGVSHMGGPYGKHGLDQEEALTLLGLSAFVEGWLMGTAGAEAAAVNAAVDEEHRRVIGLFRAGLAENEKVDDQS